MSELAKVWGKLDGETGARQPLLAHLCDVASVAEGILRGRLVRRHFERIIGRELSDAQIEWFAQLAFLHDFGKISPNFQIISKGWSGKAVGHISAAWNMINEFGLLENLLDSGCLGDTEDEQEAAFYLLLCHHGRPYNDIEVNQAQTNSSFWKRISEVDVDPSVALEELISFARRNFPSASGSKRLFSEHAALQHLFSGVLMLADWIASDRRFFPFCGEKDWLGDQRPPLNEDDVLAWSRHQAAKVLSHLHWGMEGLRPSPLPDFEAQFGFPPNGVQKAIDSLDLRPEGGLYVLEAETGSGKTEAALRLYSRLLCAGLVDGLYFANPLRFAATQLFGRLNDFSRRTFGADSSGKAVLPSTLAAPGYLRVGDSEGIRAGRFAVDWKDLGDVALGWFAESSKRYLASPLASGTIDQALMAGIRVPHADMRAAALQRSLLVVDEVHSSDAYMSELICSLLKIFSAVGGHVLLMSATLGSESLYRFRRAWKKGKDAASQPVLEEAVRTVYPRLISDTQTSLCIDAPARPKLVRMQPEKIMTDHVKVAELAAGAFMGRNADDAPCVLVLRNTVRQARETFRALRRCLPSELIFSVNGISALHHSRFAPEDRRFLDREVEKRFGKNFIDGAHTLAPRKGCVLVSTQTVEQSLDVDFDLLITDLCPADVLLQRIGRLFRHDRKRPAGFDVPRCIVLTPEEGPDWLLSPQARGWGFGVDRAYEPLAAAATLLRLNTDSFWDLPKQNRELVEGCTHHEALTKLVQELGSGKWEKARIEMAGDTMAKSSVASTAVMPWDKALKEIPISGGRTMEGLKTRLGMMDVCAACASPVCSPLGVGDITSFPIPAWMLDGKKEILQELPKSESGAFTVSPQWKDKIISFEFADMAFYYDETGLFSQKESVRQ